jgi:hypothetical protein
VKVTEFVSDTIKDDKGIGPGGLETNSYVKPRI